MNLMKCKFISLLYSMLINMLPSRPAYRNETRQNVILPNDLENVKLLVAICGLDFCVTLPHT